MKMRIYGLQIHNENGIDLDELYLFENFEDMCAEFKNKLTYHRNISKSLCAIEEPTLDEVDNEVYGMFEVKNSDDSVTIARCFDYDVM